MKTETVLNTALELPFLMHFQESTDPFVIEGEYNEELQMLVTHDGNKLMAGTTRQGPTNTPTRTGPPSDSDYKSTTDTYAD